MHHSPVTNYIKAFRAAGARGVIMAEPVAGLLWPRGVPAVSGACINLTSLPTSDHDS